jgi:hypothetical protein
MRRIFLSFDYVRDLHRVKQLAQLPGVVMRAPGGIQSTTVWNEARQRGDAALHGLIDDTLRGTSVTVVCIGQRTAHNKYLHYEIDQSLAQGNGLVGITVNHMRDQDGAVDAEAPIPPAIQAAGFKVYRFTDKKALVEQIEEAAALAEERAGAPVEAAATVHVSVPQSSAGPPTGVPERRTGPVERRGPLRRAADRERSARHSRILKKHD